MNEDKQTNISGDEPQDKIELELDDFALNPLSSAETIKKSDVETDWEILSLDEAGAPQILSDTGVLEADEKSEETDPRLADPIFAALAMPKLPELQRENRARLQMQSPNRLYLYWSIKKNPFDTLGKVLNDQQSSYQLVVKFINQKNGYEQMFPVEMEGNYWFNAESDSSYQAEIGFFAVNRPYFRIMFSNPIETPRKTPSPRQASDSDWAISAAHFAQVLDNAGFTRDAFEVALTGDDEAKAQTATQNAFTQFIGAKGLSLADFNHEEVRFALLALASGASLDDLRGHISDALFIVLQENIGKLTAENALAALQEHFDIFTEEIFEEEFTGSAVYGASLVNFPKAARKRTVPKTLVPKSQPGEDLISRWTLSPVSSFKS